MKYVIVKFGEGSEPALYWQDRVQDAWTRKPEAAERFNHDTAAAIVRAMRTCGASTVMMVLVQLG